jgi:hypothetical protein
VKAAAACAGICTAAGGMTLTAAVLATQGLAYPGYVSEAGVPGRPYWIAYRVGIFLLGAGFVLLAVAVRPLLRAAALLLLVSGALAGASGSISCTERCPLPPFEASTARNLVHAGASVLGVALCALAILLLAVYARPGGVRRVSRTAIVAIVPVGLANAYCLAFVGRGPATGIVERLLLILIVAWSLAAVWALRRRTAPVSHPRESIPA